jgi:hypothetical protein
MTMLRTAAMLGCLLVTTAHAGGTTRSTERLPELEAPPQGEAQWVAKSMRVNGLPMTLKSFQTRLTPLEVLHHYEGWSRHRGAHESMRLRNGEWQMLAIKSADYYVTIQARDAGSGSVGTIAVSPNPAHIVTILKTRFPVPHSMRIVNLQQYEDFGIESEHISLASARAAHVDAATYSDILTRAGWHILRDQSTQAIVRGHMIEAQKGAEHALLTFLPDQSGESRTAIVIVWRKA